MRLKKGWVERVAAQRSLQSLKHTLPILSGCGYIAANPAERLRIFEPLGMDDTGFGIQVPRSRVCG